MHHKELLEKKHLNRTQQHQVTHKILSLIKDRTSPDPIHSKSAAMLEKLKKLENGPSLEGVKAGEYITHKKAENE